MGDARVVGMGFARGFWREIECPSHGAKIRTILELSRDNIRGQKIQSFSSHPGF